MRAPAPAERQFPDSGDEASSSLSTFSLVVSLTLLQSSTFQLDGSSISQSSMGLPTAGQASRRPHGDYLVGCSAISRVSSFGLRDLVSIPISFNTPKARGLTFLTLMILQN